MLLDADIIYEKLQDTYNIQLLKGYSKKKIRGICCYRPDNLSGDQIYITNKEDYLRDFYEIQNAVLVLLSDEPIQPLPSSNDLLVLSSNTDIAQFMTSVTEIISDYDRWAESICQCENSFEGIKKMMNISRQFANGTYILADINLYYLYYTKDFLQYGFLDTPNSELPSEDTVKTLMSDESYPATYENQDVFFFPTYEHPYTAMCLNIFGRNKEVQARLMFLSKEKKYGYRETFILRYLGEKIEKTIYANPVYTFPIRAYQRFRESITLLIKGLHIDKNHLSQDLKKIGWSPTDIYRVFVFVSPISKSQPIALDSLCSSAEVLFSGGFATIQDHAIFLITNQSLNPMIELEEKISRFCKNYHLLAGVSNEYTDLHQTYFAAQSAQSAIEIGRGKEQESRCFFFEDCMLEYLLYYGKRDMPDDFIIHPAIKRLKTYDMENGTSYIKTLKTFLEENGGATRTARKLYIHRSTLLERIERIKTIGGLDNIFEEKTKLHLLLSLTNS